MFLFDSTERTDRKAATGVFLKVLDVGSGSIAGFFKSLHRTVAVFTAHEFAAFRERLIQGAWKPTPTHLDLALSHHWRLFLYGHTHL